MTENCFEAVDGYLTERYAPAEDALTAALAANDAARLPPIAVSPTQGKLLQLLARMIQARRIMEIGTLGGYSSLWLAGALPADGRLITLELNPNHAARTWPIASNCGRGQRSIASPSCKPRAGARLTSSS